MQVSVEKISTTERRLTIIVPVDNIEAAYENQISRVAKKANLKGFRPGKVPKTYLEQRFGQDARYEAMGDVMQTALYEALRENNLKPVAPPTVTPVSTLANQPLEFTATFEVMPEIGPIQFSADKIEKYQVEVKPEDVDHVITQLKKQYTEWKKVDRPAQLSDQVVIDYYAVYEGNKEEDDQMKSVPVELGSHVMIPGFEDGLIGATVDEERQLQLTFPQNFKMKERQGKPVAFVVRVKQIFEGLMPEVDEDFIKRLGIASGKEEDLKAQVKRTLDMERDRLVREKVKEQVFRILLEQNNVDIPKVLIEQEARSIHDEIHPSDPGHKHHHSEEEMQTFNDIAKKRLTLGVLLSEYAKQKQITVDKTLVQNRIQEIASVYEKPAEVIHWLNTKDRLVGLEAQILEDQAMDQLIADIPSTEITMSYADLKGSSQS